MWTRIKNFIAVIFTIISDHDSSKAFNELEAKRSTNLDNLEYLRTLRIKNH